MSIKTSSELMFEFLDMPEYALYKRLLAFDNSIYIFDQNYKELQRGIETVIENHESLFHNPKNRETLQQIQLDIIRRIHNFVASASSLIDHTRRLYKKLYAAHNRFPEYDTQIDQVFRKDPNSIFIKTLRQYCQHYRAPNIAVQMNVVRKGDIVDENYKCVLVSNDLLEFSNWPKIARNYIEQCGEYVDILEVSTLYHRKVRDFYAWFQGKQKEIHAEEIQRYLDKQTEFALQFLSDNVEICINTQDNMLYRADEIFDTIFSASELDKIEQLPPLSSERTNLVLKTLKKYYPASPQLCQRIAYLYSLPEYYEPRQVVDDSNSKGNQKTTT